MIIEVLMTVRDVAKGYAPVIAQASEDLRKIPKNEILAGLLYLFHGPERGGILQNALGLGHHGVFGQLPKTVGHPIHPEVQKHD
jgi:hypothetical protein